MGDQGWCTKSIEIYGIVFSSDFHPRKDRKRLYHTGMFNVIRKIVGPELVLSSEDCFSDSVILVLPQSLSANALNDPLRDHLTSKGQASRCRVDAYWL